MNKLLSMLFAVVCFSTIGMAQDQPDPHVTAASRAYHEYRLQMTEPAYGLRKVKAMIAKIKPTGEAGDDREMPVKQFNRLSVPEKFTYCMMHAEDFSQNCDPMPVLVDEQKKIFGYLPDAFNQTTWSQKQQDFLHHNRSKVISLLRSTIHAKHRVGGNLKQAIVELKAYELIPDMVQVYNRDHKDQDIITVLMLLMSDGNYAPFLKSATYKKLYGDNSNYQGFVMANRENEKLEIDRAMGYYRSRV